MTLLGADEKYSDLSNLEPKPDLTNFGAKAQSLGLGGDGI